MSQTSYEAAGVNLHTADKVTGRIKELARATHNASVLHGIGLFSGFYEFDAGKYRNPVLVSSSDGVGTKVMIAQMMQVYDSIGEDLVNHCINDIGVCGADPIYFTDYFAADKLEPHVLEGVVGGMAAACSRAGCALVGGETAEMPGVYLPGSFDLAGNITGVVEKEEILSGEMVSAGDVLIGLESNGLHTNGFSLVRQVFFDGHEKPLDKHVAELGHTLGEELLRVHRSYLPVMRSLREGAGVHAIAHITGGGIVGNTRRVLQAGQSLHIDWGAWPVPAIFDLIRRTGNVGDAEMRRVFNMGIGLVVIAASDSTDAVKQTCSAGGINNWVIGTVQKTER